MWTLKNAMEDALTYHYGMSEAAARACLACIMPELIREFLELKLVDTCGYLVGTNRKHGSQDTINPLKSLLEKTEHGSQDPFNLVRSLVKKQFSNGSPVKPT